MLHNISSDPFPILDGMRIAQGEVVVTKPQMVFTVVEAEPKSKTDRKGGFGSTGV
jgi:dUTPase